MACDTLSNVVRTTTKTIILEFVHPMELSVCSPTSQSTISSQQDLRQDLPRKPSKIQVSIEDGEVECSRMDTLASNSVPSCSSSGQMDDGATRRQRIRCCWPTSTFLASWVARHPWVVLSSSLALSIGISVAGYFFVGFSVSAELDGWLSRGTLIANQNTQISLINQNTLDLFSGDESTWYELTSNVQAGLTANNPRHDGRRSLSTTDGDAAHVMSAMFDLPGCDIE